MIRERGYEMGYRYDVGKAGSPAYMGVVMIESHRGSLSVFDRSVFNFDCFDIDMESTVCLVDNVLDIRELLSRVFENHSCNSYTKFEVREELARIDDWIEALEYTASNDSSIICPLIRELEMEGGELHV